MANDAAGDERAFASLCFEFPASCQQGCGLPDCDAADPVLGHELLFAGEALAWFQGACVDHCQQVACQLAVEGVGGVAV